MCSKHVYKNGLVSAPHARATDELLSATLAHVSRTPHAAARTLSARVSGTRAHSPRAALATAAATPLHTFSALR